MTSSASSPAPPTRAMPKRGQHVDDDRHLGEQPRRGLLDVPRGVRHPVRLVRRDRLDPERRAPVVVPARDQPVGPALGHERRDHVQEAADGVDRRPVRRRHAVRDAEEGPEVQGRRVDEHETGHAGDPATPHRRTAAPRGPRPAHAAQLRTCAGGNDKDAGDAPSGPVAFAGWRRRTCRSCICSPRDGRMSFTDLGKATGPVDLRRPPAGAPPRAARGHHAATPPSSTPSGSACRSRPSSR